MKEKNKYYTPDYSDIYVGQTLYEKTTGNGLLKLELKTIDDLVQFLLSQNKTIDNEDNETYGITPENYKVKYLDRQDIEELGWDYQNIKQGKEREAYLYNKEVQYRGEQRVAALYHVPKTNWILIALVVEPTTLFVGHIYNKTELEWILKKLKIRE